MTAFVLSGGASLGAMQVGMLAALVDSGIEPDLIVGTSVGALNGAWIAGGCGAGDIAALARLWCSMSRSDIFPTGPMNVIKAATGRGNHMVSDRGIRRVLAQNLRFRRLEDAPIPLHVVAADVFTGLDVCISTGSAVDAVTASCSIPGLLPPVDIDGRLLMDGGSVNNTPISHAVAQGATTVWVLTTGSSCGLTQAPRSALGMALHGLTRTINQRVAVDVERYETTIDLHVVPPLCPVTVSPSDFGHADGLITRATEKTLGWLSDGTPDARTTGALLAHSHRGR